MCPRAAPSRRWLSGRSCIGLRDVLQTALGAPFTHPVDVQTEFALGEALTLVGLIGLACAPAFEHRGRVLATYHDDPVVVGDDDVARADVRAGADDRNL